MLKNSQEKNHYSNIKTTQSNIRLLNRKPGRQESMGKYILRPENEWVQTKITTSKNSYFVSSTENNISKFREHRGSAPEDVWTMWFRAEEGVTRLKTLNFMKGMGSIRRAKEEKITSGSLIYISPNSNRNERITNLKKQKQIIVKQ